MRTIAGRSVNSGGNQSFLRQAAKAAGYADGSRCPSAGHIFSMAEQVRSSGRYRENGQNGLKEPVIDPAVSAARCKVESNIRDMPPGSRTEGIPFGSCPFMAAMSWTKAKTPIQWVWCNTSDTDNAGILSLTQKTPPVEEESSSGPGPVSRGKHWNP